MPGDLPQPVPCTAAMWLDLSKGFQNAVRFLGLARSHVKREEWSKASLEHVPDASDGLPLYMLFA